MCFKCKDRSSFWCLKIPNPNSKLPYDFSTGDNILMVHAEEGNIEGVNKILSQRKDININAVNKNGYTALALATKSGRFNVVGKLLVAGADPNIANHSRQGPLFLAAWHNFENIVRLLIENNAEVNATDHRGWTPLMVAVYHAHVATVKLLLSHGADVFIQDCFGKRAIHRAKEDNILKILQKAEGISPDSPKRSSPGRSPVRKSFNTSFTSPKSIDSKNPKPLSSSKKVNRSQEAKRPASTQRQQPASRSSVASDSKRNVLNKSTSTPSKPLKPQWKSPGKTAGSPSRTFTATNTSYQFLSKDGISPGYKRLHFKEELSKAITQQVGYYVQKAQTLLLQVLTYEIPTCVQGQQNSIRKELEQLINIRLGSIVKSLSTHFNVKLKFCLNKAGYDTNSAELRPFFENEEVYKLEISPISIQTDTRLTRRQEEETQNLEKLRREISRLDNEMKTTTIPLPMNDQQLAPKDENDHAFGSFGNRWQVHSQIEQQFNQETYANTQFLIEHSSEKVRSTAREEKAFLVKKLMEELNAAIEHIEDRVRTKLEQMIDEKVNMIAESLGQNKRHRTASPFKKNQSRNYSITQDREIESPQREQDYQSRELSASQSQKNLRGSPRRLSPSKAKLMHDLDEVRATGGVDTRQVDTVHGNFEPRPSYRQEESRSARASGGRHRIQGLKEDLNNNFEASPERPSHGFNKTAPAFASSLEYETTFRGPSQRDEGSRKQNYGVVTAATTTDTNRIDKDLDMKPERIRCSQELKRESHSSVTLSEADREAIEERKRYYREKLRAETGPHKST